MVSACRSRVPKVRNAIAAGACCRSCRNVGRRAVRPLRRLRCQRATEAVRSRDDRSSHVPAGAAVGRATAAAAAAVGAADRSHGHRHDRRRRSAQRSSSSVRQSPLYAKKSSIPNLLDVTHVQNTGAAFGLLNAADFPYKSAVMIGIATLALVAISLYARQLGNDEKLSRYGLALILGGAFGNLHRPRHRRLRRRLRGRLLGRRAFLGLQRRGRRHHDRSDPRPARDARARTAACIPSCLISAA